MVEAVARRRDGGKYGAKLNRRIAKQTNNQVQQDKIEWKSHGVPSSDGLYRLNSERMTLIILSCWIPISIHL